MPAIVKRLRRPLGTLLLVALAMGSVAALAAAPAAKTFAQMWQAQHVDPDYQEPGSRFPNVNKGIPRDFPVPASSHDLHASNAASVASVSGPTPAEAKAFYLEILPLQGWTISEQLDLLPQNYSVVAHKGSQWVNIGAEDSESNKYTIQFNFFEE